MTRKLTTEEFIEKAREVHGDRYGYENTRYVRTHEKVVIMCPAHGGFEQTPASHLKGRGCPVCGQKQVWDTRGRATKDDFVKRATSIHGSIFDYSKVIYKSSKGDVEIGCKIHGSFFTSPDNHLNSINGGGCKGCRYKSASESRKKDPSKFIRQILKVHGNTYIYDKTKYIDQKTKVTVTCKVHGDFTALPTNLLRGNGCYKCGRENLKWNTNSSYGIMGYYGSLEQSNLYILKINDCFVKIGLAKNISARMGTIHKDSGYSIEKLYGISGPAYKLWLLEQTILRLSNLEEYTPEISFAGQSECLDLSELENVMTIVKEWEKYNG